MSKHPTHKELTLQLRDARRWLQKSLHEYFPPPLCISVSDHDTGCQINVTLSRENMPAIMVWRGSVWYSSCYEFNDRNKQLGWNPETEFCHARVVAIFEKIREDAAAVVAGREADRVNETAKKACERRAALASYRSEFE